MNYVYWRQDLVMLLVLLNAIWMLISQHLLVMKNQLDLINRYLLLKIQLVESFLKI